MVLWTSGIVGKVCPKALLVYAHGSPDQTALPATTAWTGGVTGQSLTGSRCEWYNRVIITRCLIWPIPLLCKVLIFIRPPNKAARISSGRERERDSDREREKESCVRTSVSLLTTPHLNGSIWVCFLQSFEDYCIWFEEMHICSQFLK